MCWEDCIFQLSVNNISGFICIWVFLLPEMAGCTTQTKQQIWQIMVISFFMVIILIYNELFFTKAEAPNKAMSLCSDVNILIFLSVSL